MQAMGPYCNYGFDCSGLTRYVAYLVLGIDIGTTTGPQYTHEGTLISLGLQGKIFSARETAFDTSLLQPGDMVFWGASRTTAENHVAMWSAVGSMYTQAHYSGSYVGTSYHIVDAEYREGDQIRRSHQCAFAKRFWKYHTCPEDAGNTIDMACQAWDPKVRQCLATNEGAACGGDGSAISGCDKECRNGRCVPRTTTGEEHALHVLFAFLLYQCSKRVGTPNQPVVLICLLALQCRIKWTS
jgi:hypothetical protein